MDQSGQVFQKLFSVFNILSPFIIYYPQYHIMKVNQSIGSFSKLVCYLLLSAHLLRIIFWFGKEFHYSLLYQSFVMILVQFFLVKKVFEIEVTNKFNNKLETAFVTKSHNMLMYEFITKLLAMYMIYVFIFVYFNNSFMIEMTGLLSSLVESMLPVPQFINNLQKKSVENVSLIMVLLWALGDCAKLWFLTSEKQPVQFVYGTIFMITIDFLILWQFITYKKPVKEIVHV